MIKIHHPRVVLVCVWEEWNCQVVRDTEFLCTNTMCTWEAVWQFDGKTLAFTLCIEGSTIQDSHLVFTSSPYHHINSDESFFPIKLIAPKLTCLHSTCCKHLFQTLLQFSQIVFFLTDVNFPTPKLPASKSRVPCHDIVGAGSE